MTIDLPKSFDCECLKPAIEGQLSPAEKIQCFKTFLNNEEQKILAAHRSGAGGLEIAEARAKLMDFLLGVILENVLAGQTPRLTTNFALVAIGGYGRGALNPFSDVDLLFLLPRASTSLPVPLREAVQQVLYLLWDLGLKVGHASRSIAECIEQAQADQQNKTALMDSRLITGNEELYQQFVQRFEKDCIMRGQQAFFKIRSDDLRSRHEKHSHTVFLQEPSVKEGCGGMRDFHSILWISRVKKGTTSLAKLVEERIITAATRKELMAAYDFLHRVRNELHYSTGKATDQLTLQLQGVVATALNYPQKDILRRIEFFMRDYYLHTRDLYRHTTSLMETYEIEYEEAPAAGLMSYLTFRKKNREEFDGFVARDGRLFPSNQEIFTDDVNRLMRLFQHCQLRNLQLSPPIRRLIAAHWPDIDRGFRTAKANRQVFQAILERKGDVARTLRLMHRAGVLGRYLPEFGALDCLVQHEFFHRYTADEHTLRCIDELDQLSSSQDPHKKVYQRLFHEMQDPYALFLAAILHDAGRAENVREHIDGSAMLAARLCSRLQIGGAQRKLIMFLVDNHLTFWRTATTKNLDDMEVISQFANIVKTPSNLDALFLFTFADSKATSQQSWTAWKESLMIKLHTTTHQFLESGKEKYIRKIDADRSALGNEVLALMREDYHQEVKQHLERMPAAAFHARQASHIVTQVRTVRHFLTSEKDSNDENAICIKWIDHVDQGYSELVLACRDKPLLLEKICCALASQQINILSADFFTRADSIVVNIFRVCTTNFEPVSKASVRQAILKTFQEILNTEDYQPEKYLRYKTNFLKPRTEHGIPVPVRAWISNSLHPNCTTIEIQALDRIGLLHDLFHTINSYNLNTAHARISTEKGVAMDTLYITTQDSNKLLDSEIIKKLEAEITDLISKSETQ